MTTRNYVTVSVPDDLLHFITTLAASESRSLSGTTVYLIKLGVQALERGDTKLIPQEPDTADDLAVTAGPPERFVSRRKAARGVRA